MTSDAAAPPLRRQRVALLAHVHNTQSHYNRPAIGKQIAYQATREGVAARCAAPAVHKRSEGDVALLTSYDQLLHDVARSLVQAATPHAAHTLDLLQPGPGSGQRLRLVRLYEIPARARVPPGQEVVSYGRLVTWAKESAGQRVGTSGKKSGTAPLQWAFSAAAALCLRNNPAGQHALARVEKKHGQGKAVTSLAHQRARAVYYRRKRPTAGDMAQGLPGEGRRGGEPDASLATYGLSLERACAPAGLTASLNATGRIGLVS